MELHRYAGVDCCRMSYRDCLWQVSCVFACTVHAHLIPACLPSLRPLLNLMYHGSVNRTKPSSGGENFSHDRPVLVGRSRQYWDQDSHTSGGTQASASKEGRNSLFSRLSDNEKGPPVPEKKNPKTRMSRERPSSVGREHILVRTDLYITTEF